ncbi:MAG: tRNA pseudouridine(38-40) synthase TruA [Ruminococcaceae bacterium]|nr:tRNA pseudouridine(38-40) synthase TruA [Oscillospiraceae bacterium]
MRNLKITLCYDGTDYHGWQLQPDLITVQEVVQTALEKVFKEKVTVNGCSRTDAGVHARQFVCNCRTGCSIPACKVPVAVNTYLPLDVSILKCEEVDEEFHARFDTLEKTYCYTIWTGEFRDVFARNHEWHYHRTLDVDAMRRAAAYLIGTHDFTAFMAAGSNIKTTVRTVRDLRIDQEGERIRIFITADGYLYNMVRIIVGTLTNVGIGKTAPHDLPDIIASCDRVQAGPTAPPWGLMLYEVRY